MHATEVATHHAGDVCELRIVCHLRQLRGPVNLRRAQEITGIHRGTLSQLERMERLPKVRDIPQLELVYGPEHGWYRVRVR